MNPLRIEFLNVTGDPRLDPEIKPIRLSKDSKNMPPAFCLPWVEAMAYSLQIKSNEHYVIKKSKAKITAWIEEGGKKIPQKNLYVEVPQGLKFVPRNDEEYLDKKIRVSYSPSFSSPWQRRNTHSITLKVGICWWTPPGWGLFFTSAPHQNEEFRVVEGFVRTDLWHRDIPMVIRPLKEKITIPKYRVLASALALPVQTPVLQRLGFEKDKITELVKQISQKRVSRSIYKKLVLKK